MAALICIPIGKEQGFLFPHMLSDIYYHIS